MTSAENEAQDDSITEESPPEVPKEEITNIATETVTSTKDEASASTEEACPAPSSPVPANEPSSSTVKMEATATDVLKRPPAGTAAAQALPVKTLAATTFTISTRRPSHVPSSVPATVGLRASTSSKSKKKKSSSVTMASAPLSGDKGIASENVGRWTAEEHRLFLQGLEQHGKGWKKIASLIKTRSVVQIRTHAQKYFQKLAKARQNGEEGDVTMEGRGGVSSVASVSTAVAAQTSKRRRQTVGTKRKAIQSVVSSAFRQGKKMALAQATAGVLNPVPPLPAIAPTLAHFVLPNASAAVARESNAGGANGVGKPSISISQGTLSGPALEDSIFRFLTPAPVATTEPQVNEVARQAGANPITLPTENPSSAPTIATGEISPTGVLDLSLYPSWTDAKDMPSWYAKGADVDALLDVGDSLDWLADTGDLHETYQPPAEESSSVGEMDSSKAHGDLGQAGAENNTSVSTLPHVDSNVESVVPPLPSLFDGSEPTNEMKPEPMVSSAETHLKVAPSVHDETHLQVFENPIEEQDFVSTILENNESTVSLPEIMVTWDPPSQP